MDKWLLIKGKAGLGNRLLSSLCGIAFGRLTERRIVVDWCDGPYAANDANAFPLLFNSPVVEPNTLDLRAQSVAPMIWRDHLDWTVSNMIGTFAPRRFKDPTVYRKFCCDLSTLDHAEDLLVYWSYLPKFPRIAPLFRGELADFRGLPEHRLIKALMAKYISLQPHIQSEIDAFAAAHFHSPMIGVHVRQSDRSTPLDRLHSDLAKLVAREPSGTIFLASDNGDVVRDFTSRYPRVIFTEKWLPIPGKALHYNRDNADPERSAIEALIDIYLLSRCDYLVYPRGSTFSYVARCLGNFSAAEIVDVERYDPIVRLKRAIHSWL